jgi:drug/metabolite transporter (DMT)-like permease
MRARLIAAFAAVYLVWGSTYLAIRFAVETLPPLLMAGARFALAGLLVLAWARFAEGARAPSRIDWRTGLVSGTLLLLGGNGGVVWAEQRVPSGIASLMVAVVPLWMVLLEWLRPGGLRPTLVTVGGLALGTAGLVLLVGVPGSGGGGIDRAGTVVLLLGSLSWAAGSLASRSARLPRDPIRATAMEMLGGGTLLLLAGAATGELARLDLARVTTVSWLAWAYLVVFGSLVGFTAYIWLLAHVSAAKASTYAYVNPIVAVFLGWAVAHEPVTGRTVVAAAVIIAAVGMITLGKTRRGTAK